MLGLRRELADRGVTVQSGPAAAAAPGAKGVPGMTSWVIEVTVGGGLHVAFLKASEFLHERFGKDASLLVDGPGGEMNVSALPPDEVQPRLVEIARAGAPS